jgi:CBS domain containing-hemolysin-like protein
LRRWSPLLAIFTVLFLPVSGLLWAFSYIMQRLMGQSPQRLDWRLARGELTSILEEGHQVGILRPSQRHLAQGIFLLADRPVGEFALPTKNWHWVSEAVERDQALAVARQYEQDVLLVESANDPGCLIGYLHVPELYVDEVAVQVRVHPLMEIPNTATHLAALMMMQRASQVLARIVGPEGETLGFVTTERLCQPLFHTRT